MAEEPTMADLLKIIPDEGDRTNIRVDGTVYEVENVGQFTFNTCPKCFHEYEPNRHGPGHFERRVCLAVVGKGICRCGSSD